MPQSSHPIRTRLARVLKFSARVVLVLIGCAVAALILFEVYLRVTDQGPSRKVERGMPFLTGSDYYDYQPYMNFGEHPLLGNYPFVASKRGELPKAKNGQEYRIFIFGGSVVQSEGLKESDGILKASDLFDPRGEWWAYFEDRLNAAKPPELADVTFRVRSAGGAAYVTTNELVKLVLMDIDQYQPDLIIFLDGYNDLFTVHAYGSPPGVDHIANGLMARARWPVAYALYDLFADSLYSVAKTAEGILLLDMRSRTAEPPTPEAIGETMTENYRKARVFAEAMGANFVVALQPFAVLHQIPDNAPKDDSRFWEKYRQSDYAATLDSVRAKLASEEIRLLDYTALFDRPGGPGVATFYDSVHFYDNGYKFLVDVLFADEAPVIYADAARRADSGGD